MKRYNNYSKENLIERVKELELLLDALKDEKNHEELLIFPWTGNLGHWYWNIQTNNVICNDKKVLTLNYTKDEIPEDLGFEFFTSKLHPEDYEYVMDNMKEHLKGNTDSYEVEYRIQTKEGGWKWYYDIGKVTKRDEQNEPILIAGIVFNVTAKKEMELLIEEQNIELKEMANLDYLTKIFNRRALNQRLESEMETAKSKKENLSVIIMDIDKFKLVNDNYGHLVGDHVLKRIAGTIKKSLLGSDTVGRYGGEEFLIILPNTNGKEAYVVAERIRKNIEKEQFTIGVKVTISGGIKEYNNETASKLVDEADKCLYIAKEKGRNRIVCCEFY